MVYPIRLNDRAISYHLSQHRDTMRISRKLDYTFVFYPSNINRLNQARADLWQEACIHLSKIPKLNLLVNRVQLPSLLIEGR
jgi:hypothetical protein